MIRNLIGALSALLALGMGAGIALGFLGPWSFDYDGVAHLRPQFSIVLTLTALALLAVRWRWLGGMALAGALFGFAMLWPVWRAPEPLVVGCPYVTRSIVTANFDYANPEAPAAIAALLATNADIIALQELNDPFWRAAGPLLTAYPHQGLARPALSWPSGVGVFSKKPLRIIDVDWGPAPELHRAIVAFTAAGREIGLAAMHLERPWIEPQETQIRQLPSHLAPLPAERILLGDFNATPWSFAVAEIERIGAVRIVGGLRRTWRRVYPNPFYGPDLPALIGNQIDHFMLSEGLGVERIETFPLPGSPHWGVKAIIQIPGDPDGC